MIQRDAKAIRQLHGQLYRAGPLAVFNFHDIGTRHMHFFGELFLRESLIDP